MGLKGTRTQRLLDSFAAVQLQDEHYNYGDQTPCLRDYGIAGITASRLVAWGKERDLVCTFENGRGVSTNAYSWQTGFLKAAVEKHLELFGEEGKADLTPALLELVAPAARERVRNA